MIEREVAMAAGGPKKISDPKPSKFATIAK
jgi:hypothetical protein